MKRVCRLLPCSLLAAVLLCAAPRAWGQLEINSSPNVVGSGARALGMGGAFIAIADDATAASWNPGGLTQLERPELSLVYNWKWLEEDFSSSSHPELDGSQSVDFNEINYFSFVYPIRRTIGGRNLVLSINYQRKYDFDRDINVRFRDITAGTFGTRVGFNSKVDYSQRGGLSAISPAFGFELTDKLSVGLVANIWNQSLLPDNEWKTRTTQRLVARINGSLFGGSWTSLRQEEDFQNFEGLNFTIGALYKPNSRWSIGLRYDTKFSADVTYKQYVRRGTSGGGLGFLRERRPQEYTFPAALGLGVAYRFPNDKLTLSMDVTRREWDQFEIRDPENRSFLMRRRSGVTGLPMSQSPKIDPTYTVRLGMEYVFVDDSKPEQHWLPSLRAGIYYDPEPSGGRKDRFWGIGTNALSRGDGSPDDYWGVALGAGVLIRDRVNIDMAYTYRWGKDVRKDTFGLFGTDADVDQHTLYLSTVIYF